MTSRQATVRAWGAEGGSVVLDDGSCLQVGAEVLETSVFRFVRPGQRVRVGLDGDRVVRLDLP